MRKIFLVVIAALLPLLALGNEPPPAHERSSARSHNSDISHILMVSAGVIGGLIIADLLVGGVMTTPFVEAVTPAMQEARAAGAVFGEQIAAATGLRDAEARADLLYALIAGSGALLGGWMANRYMSREPASATSSTATHGGSSSGEPSPAAN